MRISANQVGPAVFHRQIPEGVRLVKLSNILNFFLLTRNGFAMDQLRHSIRMEEPQRPQWTIFSSLGTKSSML